LKGAEHASQTQSNGLSELTTRSLRFGIELALFSRSFNLAPTGGHLSLFGVIGANMGSEFFVALRLEVAHHFIESCADGRTGGFEPPATFGAAKTPKTLLLNPYQLPAHGRPNRTGANLDGLSGVLHTWKKFVRGMSEFRAWFEEKRNRFKRWSRLCESPCWRIALVSPM
jgi:hypothetical protein